MLDCGTAVDIKTSRGRAGCLDVNSLQMAKFNRPVCIILFDCCWQPVLCRFFIVSSAAPEARLTNFHAKASHLWVFGANTLCTACAHTKACRTKLLIKISHSKAWQRGKQTVSWHQNIIKSSSGGFFVFFLFPVSPRIHKPFHQYAN